MSKTIEEQIEAAEKDVERCEGAVEDAEAELADAQDALDEAEEHLAALESEKNAPLRAEKEARKLADLTERTGPQRPIGDRVVRTSCDVGEIPKAYAAAMSDERLIAVCGADGSKWASNGHWLIRVNSNDGLRPIPSAAESVIGTIGQPLEREDAPRHVGSTMARTFGGVGIALEYASLVEDLFPGIEWRGRRGEYDPLQAVIDGVVVAAVMPLRGVE